MAIEITMPKLSDTMTEGKLGAWKKSVGDRVQRGDVLAEVETDKAVMDLEAFTTGILLEQRIKAGELVAVGTVIGIIGAPGEQPTAVGVVAPPPEPVPTDVRTGDVPERVMEEVQPPAEPLAPAPVPHREERAAPVVRRRARELGIDLALVEGSGPGGRILLEDLERFSGVSLAAGEAATLPAEPQTGEVLATAQPETVRGGEVAAGEQPLSRMRAAIARAVEQSWRTIPHFFVTMEIAMDAAEEVRRELKESGTAVSVNDMVVKGAALAIASYPLVNASFAGDRLVVNQAINIGIAVSLPDGLLVPVLRGCEGLPLRELAVRSRSLAERARTGRLSDAELSGGTFSVSNLGMYGVHQFTAIIHPGQAAILAVGGVQETVTVHSGQPAVGKTMLVTLSADHRALDGAYAARFLRELRTVLENPVKLLL